MNLYSLFVLIIVSFLGASCRSTDKGTDAAESEPLAKGELVQEDGEIEKEEEVGKIGLSGVDCSTRPAMKSCCQALTPSCNECKSKNQKIAEQWESQCQKERKLDCGKNPPISGCCTEPTEECRNCRQSSIERLVEYKQRCGSYSVHKCESKPPLVRCSSSYTPSAVSCRSRNNRILSEWRSRCG